MTVYNIFAYVGIAALVLTVLRWFFLAKPSNLFICYLQNFVGSLFIFSGFVKAVDPLGTGFKMEEYFEAFAGEGFRPFWEWIAHFSSYFAILMIALELFIGFMLLIGWKPKFTIAIIWFLTLFFTFLTGYTYLSGYCISKLFIVLSFLILLLFAAVAIPKDDSKRLKLFAAAFISFLVVWIFCKLSGKCFLCGFTETGMKVTDCGCFGDFIKLKPWETFWKDVLLDVMILILVIGGNSISSVFSSLKSNIIAVLVGIISMALCLYNVYFNEPVIDFRPYKAGSNIVEARKVLKPEVRQMIFVYRSNKTGEAKEFTYDEVMKGKMDYAEYDSMLERKDSIIDAGIPAKITNLRIENEEGTDLTDTLLADKNYSLMVVARDLHATDVIAFKQLNAIATECDKMKIHFYAVTVNDGHVEEFRHANQTAYPFYHADATPLKTIIRSNPGLVLFRNGVVIAKWHYKHLPTFDELNKNYFSK